jgi:hypothetical protein
MSKVITIIDYSPTPPPCFGDTHQWHIWNKARVISQEVSDTPVNFCTDCTPEYKALMEVAQRCSYPEVTFQVDAEGWDEGVRGEMRAFNDWSSYE